MTEPKFMTPAHRRAYLTHLVFYIRTNAYKVYY